MCGIAGFVLRSGEAQVSLLAEMCARITHRGPDDEGLFVDGPCAIGMRRLSIIDLATGHQPIANEDGSLWVVFNGEIYNYQSLRAELIQQGHKFSTSSDTEVLLHLYEQYGEEGVARLRGMFAFAIWDTKRRRLFIARDRFGKKPLYFADTPHGFYFGSELKCLAPSGVPLRYRSRSVEAVFPVPLYPRSVHRFLCDSPPGRGFMADGEADGRVRKGRYWKLPAPAAESAQGGRSDASSACARDVRRSGKAPNDR